jgi:dihydropteroate synthase
MAHRGCAWDLSDRILQFDERPLVMGVINVTPDSFSDGGRFSSVEAAVEHGRRLAEQGADILDIGGESSRPGASPVPLAEELRRLLPVVERLTGATRGPLSIDTYKAEVARQCLAAGARIVNDITGVGDPQMQGVVRDHRAGVILMHMQGDPQTMQQSPHYVDVVQDIAHFLEKRLQELSDVGIPHERIVLDPGIGFGKTGKHNLEIIARLGEFRRFQRPICLGVSRKAFIGKLLDRPVDRRLAASLAVAAYAATLDTVQIVRVHDVEETCDLVKMIAAIRSSGSKQ